MEDKYGIEFNVFEYKGMGKKRILNYHASPGNIESGINLIKTKIGINLKEMEDNTKLIKKKARKLHESMK